MVVVGAILLFILYVLTRNVFDYTDKLRYYEQYKELYNKEKNQNLKLKTQIAKQNDPSELEKTIREKLNLLRPDEVDILLPSPTPTPPSYSPTEAPNWIKWRDVFFHP
jgi:cell division protein FtsB